MEIQELIKKVRELEIRSRRLTNHLFTGEYHTAFRGRGMMFREVREYQAGDDVRFIDWNTSARMGHTYTKLFEEERELSVYLLVDMSASNLFGTFRQNKKDLITEICAVLSFSAISNNDKAGLICFSKGVDQYIPAAKGRDHVLYMVRELLSFRSLQAETNISEALRFLNNVTRHKSIVFLMSDFADSGYKEVLRVAARRHDIIGIQVYDRRDEQLPRAGLMQVRDAETGAQILMDTSDPYTRLRYQQQYERILGEAKENFRSAGTDLLQIATGSDYVNSLREFFIRRA